MACFSMIRNCQKSLLKHAFHFPVSISPIVIIENLFFAIFGQKGPESFTLSFDAKKQPLWTLYLFKVRNGKNIAKFINPTNYLLLGILLPLYARHSHRSGQPTDCYVERYLPKHHISERFGVEIRTQQAHSKHAKVSERHFYLVTKQNSFERLISFFFIERALPPHP